MGLKKGTTNNPNGRPKGSANKLTGELRELFQSVIEENIEQVLKDIKKLSPKDRITAFLKLSEFVLPKLKSIDPNSRFSEENYREYLTLKARHDEIASMTDEELKEAIRKLHIEDDDN